MAHNFEPDADFAWSRIVTHANGPSRSSRRKRFAMEAGTIITGLLVATAIAPGQEQSAAQARAEHATDVILARKTLMNAVEENSDRIARMISDQFARSAQPRGHHFRVAHGSPAF